jgi:hypothetical protein
MLRSAALAALMIIGSSGCYKNTYTTGQPMGGSIHTLKATYFIFGLVGDASVDLDQLCPSGVAWFQNRMDPVDAVLTCVTCSLYTPLTIEVRCASGQAWLAVPDEDEGLTWIYAIDENSAPLPYSGETLELGGM